MPLFENQSGYSVHTLSVGSGQALALAALGDADVALVHAPSLEEQFVVERKLLNRRSVMYNDFVIIGPKEDLAKVRSTKSAATALKAIEQAKANFVSRGDNSGTHVLEKSLWQSAGIEPNDGWYIETGQGMGATLEMASKRNAYTITDRGSYLALSDKISLPILVECDRSLLNTYSVLEVNPANGPRVNVDGGKAFADFMVAPQTQNAIRSYGVDKYGQSLFIPGELMLPPRPRLKTNQTKKNCPNQCLSGYLRNQRLLSAMEYCRLPDSARDEIGKKAPANVFYCMYCDCVWIECDSGESYPLGRLIAGHRWQSRLFP